MNSEPAGLVPEITESLEPPHDNDPDAESAVACWLCVTRPLVVPETACVTASVTSEVEISFAVLLTPVVAVACLVHAVNVSAPAAARVKNEPAIVSFFIPKIVYPKIN